MASEAPRSPDDTETLVTFRIGETWLGLPAAAVEEFCDVGKVLPIPAVPAHVPGMINLRGHAVPLVDLQRFWQLKAPRDPGPNRRVIVVRAAGMRVGLLCDQVRGLENFVTQPGAEPFEGTAWHRFIRGQLQLGQSVAPIVDIATLLEAARVRPR